VLEVLNARYEPRVVETDGEERKMEFPSWSADDRSAARWARDVCWKIISLSRKDGRDLPAGESEERDESAPAEPVERRPEGSNYPGALVILDADTGAAVSISP
jgi:hypothetical protein